MYVDNLISDFPKGLMDLSSEEAQTFIDTEVEEQLERLTDQEYDEFLDETGEMCNVGSLEYSPSDVLKNCDPTAYRVGFTEFQEFERESTEEQVRELVRAELEAHENYVLS